MLQSLEKSEQEYMQTIAFDCVDRNPREHLLNHIVKSFGIDFSTAQLVQRWKFESYLKGRSKYRDGYSSKNFEILCYMRIGTTL